MDPVVGAARVVHQFIEAPRPVDAVIADIAHFGAAAVGGDGAGLTALGLSGQPSTIASTDDLVVAVEEAQYGAGRGPCLDAIRAGVVHVVEDLAAERRWPEFRDAASSCGIRSSLSVPVVVRERVVGALNFYGGRAHQLGGRAVELASLFAGHVAVVTALHETATLAADLRRALESRAVIEQAKGIIMATTGCGADAAFDTLRQQSQSENRKLREIAAEIVTWQRTADEPGAPDERQERTPGR